MEETAEQKLAQQILSQVKGILRDQSEHELEKVEIDRSYSMIDSYRVCLRLKDKSTLSIHLTMSKKPAVIERKPLQEAVGAP